MHDVSDPRLLVTLEQRRAGVSMCRRQCASASSPLRSADQVDQSVYMTGSAWCTEPSARCFGRREMLRSCAFRRSRAACRRSRSASHCPTAPPCRRCSPVDAAANLPVSQAPGISSMRSRNSRWAVAVPSSASSFGRHTVRSPSARSSRRQASFPPFRAGSLPVARRSRGPAREPGRRCVSRAAPPRVGRTPRLAPLLAAIGRLTWK